MPATNQPAPSPRTLRDLFPSRYLCAADLSRPVKVTISRITFEKLRGRDGEETKALVWFVGARKCLVLNKTQATALANMAHSEAIDDWTGLTVVLAPSRAQNGKDTIAVLPAPAVQPAAIPVQPGPASSFGPGRSSAGEQPDPAAEPGPDAE